MIQEIGKVKFKRVVVPEDTIDATDASKKLACTAIYPRFLMKDGTYSCQFEHKNKASSVHFIIKNILDRK